MSGSVFSLNLSEIFMYIVKIHCLERLIHLCPLLDMHSDIRIPRKHLNTVFSIISSIFYM